MFGVPNAKYLAFGTCDTSALIYIYIYIKLSQLQHVGNFNLVGGLLNKIDVIYQVQLIIYGGFCYFSMD